MKKLLSIIMISLFILNLSSCGEKENPLVMDGHADATGYTIYVPFYTPDHPLSEIWIYDRSRDRPFQRDDAYPMRKIKLEEKTYNLTYKESVHCQHKYDLDVYYPEDGSFSVSYYAGTTTIASIESVYQKRKEDRFSLENLFSIEPKFETEADYIEYSRQLAGILGIDISNSHNVGYTSTDSPLDNDKGFLLDDEINGAVVTYRGMDWVNNQENGIDCNMDVFNIRCNYITTDSGEKKIILSSINFPAPFPEKVFYVSKEKAKEMIKSVYGEDFSFEIIKYEYTMIHNNHIVLLVKYSCVNDLGIPGTQWGLILPDDMDYSEWLS